ncbi:MAG: prepilin-type N-terminal cleavage/methylation domain-containing protein, partial [Proteobacteria bacterium]|nr:prepilin-type N-terminal cleavage/methylation domain-containing protein [Pseudomonadota bacterium]
MAKKRVQRGFTLVELLVGLTVGLITLLVLTQLLQSFEGQKRTSTGGNDAQTNGAFALYMLDREIRMSGYGVFGPESMLCKRGINMYYDDPAGGGATVQNAAS